MKNKKPNAKVFYPVVDNTLIFPSGVSRCLFLYFAYVGIFSVKEKMGRLNQAYDSAVARAKEEIGASIRHAMYNA